MAIQVTEGEFLEWMVHPVTREYLRFLAEWQEGLKGQWAARMFQRESMEESALANAEALSEMSTIQALREVDYEKMREVLDDDDEQVGA